MWWKWGKKKTANAGNIYRVAVTDESPNQNLGNNSDLHRISSLTNHEDGSYPMVREAIMIAEQHKGDLAQREQDESFLRYLEDFSIEAALMNHDSDENTDRLVGAIHPLDKPREGQQVANNALLASETKDDSEDAGADEIDRPALIRTSGIKVNNKMKSTFMKAKIIPEGSTEGVASSLTSGAKTVLPDEPQPSLPSSTQSPPNNNSNHNNIEQPGTLRVINENNTILNISISTTNVADQNARVPITNPTSNTTTTPIVNNNSTSTNTTTTTFNATINPIKKMKPINLMKQLFNAQKCEETIFWKSYTELEQNNYKYRGMKSLRKFIIYLYYWFLERAQHAAMEIHSSSPFYRQFWLFFLERTQYIGLTVFGINATLVLIGFGIVISWNVRSYQQQYGHTTTNPSYSFLSINNTIINNNDNDDININNELARLRLSFILYMFSWMIVHLCCFTIYLLVYLKCSVINHNNIHYNIKFIRNIGKRIIDTDILMLWSMVTRFIKTARFLQLIMICFITWLQPLLEGKDTSRICFGIDILPSYKQDYSFLIIISIFDMYQVLTLAFLPAPWPWMLRIGIIEFVSTLLKLSTCSYLLIDFEMKANFLMCIYIGLLVYYVFIVAGSTLYFENSMRNAYSNIQEQQKSANERQQLVDMLCREIKLPAQEVLQILTSLNTKKQSLVMTMGGVEIDSFLDAAKSFSSALNILVDDFLFLTKVEEGRFTMNYNDMININELFLLTSKVLLQSIKWPYHGSERFVNFQHVQQSSLDIIYGEQSSLRVIFYHSMLCMISLLCNDKLEKFAKILLEYLPNAATIQEPLFSVTTYQTKRKKSGREPISRKGKNLEDQGNADAENDAIFLHVTIVFNSDEAIRLIQNRPKKSASSGIGQHQGMFESSSIICHKLANAALGNWSVYRNRVEFSVRIQQEASTDGRRPIVLPSWLEKVLKTTPSAPISTPRRGMIIDSNASVSSTGSGSTNTGVGSQPNDTVRKPDKTNNIKTLETCKMLLQNAQLTNILVYVNDPSYETMIVEILTRLFGNRINQIAIHNSISLADLKHYKLLMVMSIAHCQELHLKHFRGPVILFSERLTYLDEYEETLFDYSVPLPCTEHALITLAEYLRRALLKIKGEKVDDAVDPNDEQGLQKPIDQAAMNSSSAVTSGSNTRTSGSSLFKSLSTNLNNTRRAIVKRYNSYEWKILSGKWSLADQTTSLDNYVNTYTNESMSMFFTPSATAESTFRLRRAIIYFIRYIKSLYQFVCDTIHWISYPIHPHRHESYNKWRTLAPIGVYGHHTMYLETLITIAILCSLSFRLLGVTQLRTCFVSVIILTSYSCRGFAYNYLLRKYGISYTLVWSFCSWLNIFIPVVTIWNEFVGIRDGKPYLAIEETRHNTPTLLDFMSMRHANSTGLQSLLFLFILPLYLRFQLEFFLWPYGYFSGCLVIFRSVGVYIFYIARYLPHAQRSFMLIMILLICGAMSGYQYLIEKLNTESFTTLYDLLILKDFKDRLLIVANVTFTQPLQQLQELQTVLLESVCNQAYQDRVWITKELHVKMSSLRSNIVLSKELLMQLKIAEPSFFRQQRSVFLSSMKAKLVINLVNKVCSHVLSGFTDLQVKIVFKLHPAIALIRVDEDLFSSLLGNICRRAIQEIRYRSGLHGLASADMTSQEIFLWIRPDDSTSSLGRGPAGGKKFTDIRTMLITAFDMCPIGSSRCPLARTQVISSTGSDNHGIAALTFPLCDRFMQYFGQSARFMTNNLGCSPESYSHTHSLYQHYQQIAIPYLLCPDSYKLQQLLERVGFHNKLHAIQSRHEQAYQIYKKSNIELIDEVDRLVNTAAYYRHRFITPMKEKKQHPMLNDPTSPTNLRKASMIQMSPSSASLIHGMQTLYQFTNSRQWVRSFTGNVLIFCLDTSEHTARYLRSQEHFKSVGWSSSSVILRSINDIIWRLDNLSNGLSSGSASNISTSNSSTGNSSTTGSYDCLILDVDIEKILSKGVNGVKSEYDVGDIKGLVHLIRSFGFMGLIAVTHPNPEKFNRSTGLNAFSRSPNDRASYYVERRQKLESHSPYSEAVSVDVHLTLPLTETSAQQIAKLCEWNVYKAL